MDILSSLKLETLFVRSIKRDLEAAGCPFATVFEADALEVIKTRQ